MKTKRWIVTLLCFLLIRSMIPINVSAAGGIIGQYTLILDENWAGGTSQVIPNVSSYELPSATRPGETFYGWSVVPDGQVRYHAGDTVTLAHDLTLYAIWQDGWSDAYYVIFDANGGTGTMKPDFFTTQYPYKAYEIPDCGFTRQGYTFVGWATSPTGVVEYLPGDSYKTLVDLFLFAIWKQNDYHTITYKVVNGTWSDGGTQDKTEVVAEGTSPKQIPDGMKPNFGYIGGKWDIDPASAIIIANTTFTYTFEKQPPDPVSYTIVGFKNEGPNGAIEKVSINGENVPENTGGTLKIVADAQDVNVEVKFNRGYTFGKWFDSIVLRWGGVQSGSTNIDNSTDPGSIDMPGSDWYETEDQELYLIIQTQALPMFDVDVQTDGCGIASANLNPALEAEEVLLIAVPDTGYRFKEWQSTDVTITDNKFIMPAKRVSIIAMFEAIPTYTVTFNMNGHGTAIDNQIVNENGNATKPDDPVENGYTFKGWYTDASFKTAYDFNIGITADTTIYAKWAHDDTPAIPTNYTITFNMNGHGTQIGAQTVEEGSKAIKPENPTANGYIFKGWYTDSTFQKIFDFNTAIYADITLYAKWMSNSAPTGPIIPQTGDKNNSLLMLLIVTGGIFLTEFIIYSRKRRQN